MGELREAFEWQEQKSGFLAMNRDRIFGVTVIVALVSTVALAVALGIDLAEDDDPGLAAGAPASAYDGGSGFEAGVPSDASVAEDALNGGNDTGAGSAAATTPGTSGATGGSTRTAPSGRNRTSSGAASPSARGNGASANRASEAPAAGGGRSAGAAPAPGTPGIPTPGGTPEGEGSPGITAGSIKIGAIFPLSGPINFGLVQQAVSSYFNMVNEAGGIHGRKIDFVYYDDGWDQQKSIQLARRLVEQDKVFAMVGNFQFFTADGVVPYLEEVGIPLIGPDSVALRELQSNVVFPMGLSTCTDGIANAAAVIEGKFTRPAQIHVAGNSAMTRIIECENATLMQAGITPVSTIGVSIAEPDFTQAVLRTRSANPDVLVLEHDASATLRTWQAMQRQNFALPMMGPYPAYDTLITDYAKNYPEQAKEYSLPTGAIPIERPNAEVRKYTTTTRKYFPESRLGYFGELAWAGAKLFTEAMTQLGGAPTRAQLIDYLNGLKNWDSGVTKPISFNPGPKDPNHWWFRMKLDNYDKWAPVTRDWITHRCTECERRGWTQPAA